MCSKSFSRKNFNSRSVLYIEFKFSSSSLDCLWGWWKVYFRSVNPQLVFPLLLQDQVQWETCRQKDSQYRSDRLSSHLNNQSYSARLHFHRDLWLDAYTVYWSKTLPVGQCGYVSLSRAVLEASRHGHVYLTSVDRNRNGRLCSQKSSMDHMHAFFFKIFLQWTMIASATKSLKTFTLRMQSKMWQTFYFLYINTVLTS